MNVWLCEVAEGQRRGPETVLGPRRSCLPHNAITAVCVSDTVKGSNYTLGKELVFVQYFEKQRIYIIHSFPNCGCVSLKISH
jgi:hypothetical protein